MKVDTYSLPAYWASFLVNGDASGLDDVELGIIKKWMDVAGVKGACLSCSDEPEFRRYHSAYPEVLATDCLDFHFPA
jgi:hypothetical protein